MRTLLKRIQASIGTGAALCAAAGGCTDAVTRADSGVDAATVDCGTDGSAPDSGHDGSTDSGSDAATYNVSELGCFGPVHDDGYFGQCCVSSLCYTASSSSACLPANDTTLPSTLVGFPPGSGGCSCGDVGFEAVRGPFAPNPDNPDEAEGNCCYLVGEIGCTGRPLLVDGTALVASVVVRSDWV